MNEKKYELPEGCDVADFIVFPPWRVSEDREMTLWARVVRRVYSNGSSTIELQLDTQTSGSCGPAFRAEKDSTRALRIVLEKLARLESEKIGAVIP